MGNIHSFTKDKCKTGLLYNLQSKTGSSQKADTRNGDKDSQVGQYKLFIHAVSESYLEKGNLLRLPSDVFHKLCVV